SHRLEIALRLDHRGHQKMNRNSLVQGGAFHKGEPFEREPPMKTLALAPALAFVVLRGAVMAIIRGKGERRHEAEFGDGPADQSKSPLISDPEMRIFHLKEYEILRSEI